MQSSPGEMMKEVLKNIEIKRIQLNKITETNLINFAKQKAVLSLKWIGVF